MVPISPWWQQYCFVGPETARTNYGHWINQLSVLLKHTYPPLHLSSKISKFLPWRHVGGSNAITPSILILGARWKSEVNFISQRLYPPPPPLREIKLQYPKNKRVSGSRAYPEVLGKTKNFVTLQGFEPWTVKPLARFLLRPSYEKYFKLLLRERGSLPLYVPHRCTTELHLGKYVSLHLL